MNIFVVCALHIKIMTKLGTGTLIQLTDWQFCTHLVIINITGNHYLSTDITSHRAQILTTLFLCEELAAVTTCMYKNSTSHIN